MIEKKFKILKDSREQLGWIFSETDRCLGTEICTMPTADYTIKGLEDKVLVERKGTVSELAKNVHEDRFHRELDRMDKIKHSYLVLEFPFEYIVTFPAQSNIPKYLWKKIKLRGQNFIRIMHELQLKHPKLHIVYAGSEGKKFTLSLFKRIIDLYG